MFKSPRLIAARKRNEEKELYEIVALELGEDKRDEALWIKAISESEGNEFKAKAR